MKILFAVASGSRAFNLHTDDSDADVRGVAIPTIYDLSNPYGEKFQGNQYASIYGSDAYFYEWSHFLHLLAAQDVNAWIALMSDRVLFGSSELLTLRHAAIYHLLDSERLLERALGLMHAMVREGFLKDSPKIIANGLKAGVFGTNMCHAIPKGCDLGMYRDLFFQWKYQKEMPSHDAVENVIEEIKAETMWLRVDEHIPTAKDETIGQFYYLYMSFTGLA